MVKSGGVNPVWDESYTLPAGLPGAVHCDNYWIRVNSNLFQAQSKLNLSSCSTGEDILVKVYNKNTLLPDGLLGAHAHHSCSAGSLVAQSTPCILPRVCVDLLMVLLREILTAVGWNPPFATSMVALSDCRFGNEAYMSLGPSPITGKGTLSPARLNNGQQRVQLYDKKGRESGELVFNIGGGGGVGADSYGTGNGVGATGVGAGAGGVHDFGAADREVHCTTA